MNYVPNSACLAAAKAAAGESLSEQEVLDAFQRVNDYRERLQAEGKLTGSAERLRRFGAEEAERTRIAAALERRNAALNIIVRNKIDAHLKGLQAGGVRPQRAMLAILEGTQRPVEGGRVSVATQRMAYHAKYAGAMFAELQRDAPHIAHLLDDPKLDADTLREMLELRNGGKPGVTGNKDAIYLARTFAKYSELSRTDANKLGASIGKLDGWAGVQQHDDVKMIHGPSAKDRWVGYVATKLDLEKTFPEGLTSEESAKSLGDIYDTIITGFSNKATAAEKGQFTAPAGLAKSLAASRVLHFKDADSALAYREQYGYSNTIGGMFSHLRNMARINANMETLGPNPEAMFGAVAKSVRRQIKEAKEVPPGTVYGLGTARHMPTLEEWKNTEAHLLNVQHGVLRQGLDIATGASSRPVSMTGAKIGSNIRAVQTMAKIGASLPSLITDVPISGGAAQFRGGSFLRGVIDQMTGVLGAHRTPVEKEIAYLYGEGFDGLLGHIHTPAAGEDRLTGGLAKAMVGFLKWSGHSWWTDASRATAGRVIAAEMGMRSTSAYAELPGAYRKVLSMNGIDEKRWDIIRSGSLVSANGRQYVTPDAISNMPDEAFLPVVQDRLDTATAKGGDDLGDRRASILADGRRDVQLSLLRFVADETAYSVMTRDAVAQRWMTQGKRPGTIAGEAMRFLMQFKGFPATFMSRVGGRALYGYTPGESLSLDPKTWAGEQGKHIGSLMAGLTVAGYMAMVMKDTLKGYWPPRNPSDPRTMLAALEQSGGLGIYGDFIFGASNRFGGSTLETLAGPTIGATAQAADIGLDIRDYYAAGGKTPTGQQAKFPFASALSLALGNTPFANLHLLKPAMDYLLLNSLREAISPGYLRRSDTDRERQYGQVPITSLLGLPRTAQGNR